MSDKENMVTDERFNSPAYRRSRIAYISQCTFAYFATILTQDAFIAKVLTEVGMSDSAIGLISGIERVGTLFQLLTLLLMNRMRNVKKTVILFDSMSIFLMGLTFLIPFLPLPRPVKILLVFICVGGGYLFKNIIASLFYKWGNSFVKPKKLGRFSATKEMISLSTGIAFTLVMGFVMDHFEEQDRLYEGFVFLAVSMLLLWVANFVSSLLIANTDRTDAPRQRRSLRDVLRNTFGNRKFVVMMLLQIVVTVAVSFTSGFIGTYKIKELMFSVGTVQLINMSGSLSRFLISRPFGRFSDKHSFAGGYSLGILFSVAGFACLIFTAPSTRWLIIGYAVFHNASLAGTNANGMNMMFNAVSPDYYAQAAAINSGILGLLGFLASLAGSAVLGSIQAAGNIVFGIRGIYGQQFLALVSTLILIAAFFFSRTLVKKQNGVR